MNDSRAEYERRLHKVLAYIDAHLDSPISVSQLARQANFSEFHFHRIFSLHIGETVGNYLTRRRIEQAAGRLASQPRVSVLTVALAVGFGSAEAFSRAFKKHFGSAPLHWKAARVLALKKNSKLSQIKSRTNHEGRLKKRYTPSVKNSSPLSVSITTRPSVRVAYLRYQGPFGTSVGKFWQVEVIPWMAANNLISAPKYGIARDLPAVTAENKLRYDAGAEVGKDFIPSKSAQVGTLPGGLYAASKFSGLPHEIQTAWDRLLGEWLPESGYQLDGRPCFEYYSPEGEGDEKTGAFSCELCIPIAPL